MSLNAPCNINRSAWLHIFDMVEPRLVHYISGRSLKTNNKCRDSSYIDKNVIYRQLANNETYIVGQYHVVIESRYLHQVEIRWDSNLISLSGIYYITTVLSPEAIWPVWGPVTYISVTEPDHHWFRHWLVPCSAPSHCLNQVGNDNLLSTVH